MDVITARVPKAAKPFLQAAQLDDMVTCRQVAALTVIHSNPGLSTRHIAAALGVSKPAITRAVGKLGELGLVVTRQHPDDLRNRVIETTPAGRKVVEDLS